MGSVWFLPFKKKNYIRNTDKKDGSRDGQVLIPFHRMVSCDKTEARCKIMFLEE